MKAKNLFLTIALFLLPLMTANAAVSTDVLSTAGVTGTSRDITFSGASYTSGAQYSGAVYYDNECPLFYMDDTYVLATTAASPGTAKSITITWDISCGWNDASSEIFVYGKNTPYFGTETFSTITGTLIASQTYDGSTSHTLNLGDAYEYIAIVTPSLIAFKQLSISWTVPDVASYSISTSVTYDGGSFTPAPGISVTPASPVAVGTTVTVSFSGKANGELHSYSIEGASVIESADLDEDEYTKSLNTTFVMPDHDVDITGVFGGKPGRKPNNISVNGETVDYVAELTSGETSDFTISMDYSAPSYTRGLKSVTSANGKVEIVSNTFNSSTGTGTLTLRGLSTGSDVVTITSYQTDNYSRSTRRINVTVVARDVALVTELNGKYYAVTNSPSGTTVAAVELFEDGGYYYYKSAGDLSNISWKAENTADGYYIRNSADQYLKVAGATMSLSGSTYEWYKNAGDAFVTGYTTGICYDESYSAFVITGQNDHSSVSTISACVHEIPVASLALATEYTRSLTNGNYATMCLPFAVSASETFFSGAEVYIIVGKHVSAGNVTGIELEQVTGNLVAGKPYVILATASTLSAWHGADLVGSPVNGDGLVGNLNSDPLTMPDGTYGIKGNKLRKINGGTGKVNQYRAYINLDGIPEVAATPTPAPGRRVIVTENSTESEEQQDVETSLEDLLNHATSINWNEPVYNVLGQRVGEGTTGVLIQNGQKFFVQ